MVIITRDNGLFIVDSGKIKLDRYAKSIYWNDQLLQKYGNIREAENEYNRIVTAFVNGFNHIWLPEEQ